MGGKGVGGHTHLCLGESALYIGTIQGGVEADAGSQAGERKYGS